MSKVWRILQVNSRLLVIQDIISTTITTTTTTIASDAKLDIDAHLLERYFRNFERCRKSGESSKLAADCLYFRTSSPPLHYHHHHHHCIWCQVSQRCTISWEIFQKFWEMSKVWRILQVSSRLLVFQDIISTSTTTTTASDAKLAIDAHLLERYFRNFERCRKSGETSKLEADCL